MSSVAGIFYETLGRGRMTPDQKAEYKKCASDAAYWIDTYCWTYNPKLPPVERWLRFRLFPRQFELVEWIIARESARESGLIEKSREVGCSWLVMAVMTHHWLFEEGFKGGAGSRVEDLVDKLGDPDSLFEKVRMLIRKLPEWMLPDGFDERKHLGFMKLINPENGSVLTGESGDNIGRGGRNSMYFVDEEAFIEHQELVESALSHNADCIIGGSTVNGIGNNFYRKRFSGSIPVFIFDWRDDPRKTQAWYDSMKEKYAHNPALMASEVDRDYSASIEGVCIPGKWVKAAIDAHLNLPWSESGNVVAAADIAAGGANLTVFGHRQGSRVTGLKETNEPNTITSAHSLIEWSRECGASVLKYDAKGIGVTAKSKFELEKEALGFKTQGIDGGAACTETRWADGKSSKEMFANFRAEIYWRLRLRFERTYEAIEGLAAYDSSDLISIPFHPEMIAQLSMPLKKPTPNGKIKIESKDDMLKRGIKSPDWADMLVYLFAPDAPSPTLRQVVTTQKPATITTPGGTRRNRGTVSSTANSFFQ
jgi:phage terminase large subunit